MKVHVTGQVLQQYVDTRNCRTVWLFFERCSTNRNPRDSTLQEIENIKNGLLHFGYNKLRQEINTLTVLFAQAAQVEAANEVEFSDEDFEDEIY